MLETEHGFHVVKTDEVRPSVLQELDKVRDTIRERLAEEQLPDLFEQEGARLRDIVSAHTSLDSLAEALMKSERGGAIAVWASSGMTTTDKMELMAQQMFRLIFSDGTSLTLGEATSRAKAATGDMDVRRSWILFGDPTMQLK